jgi:RHS repeat-associated protein
MRVLAVWLVLATSSLPVAFAVPPSSGPPVILPPQLDDPPDSPLAPTAGAIDASPEHSTDVSTRIATGCGYDAYTGSVRRTVTDLIVPGAIGSRGLNIVRTYSSLTPWISGWSFYPGWRIEGKPSSGDGYLVYFPDGRISKFQAPRSTQAGETAWRAGAGTNERLFLQSTNQYVGTADLWLEDGTRVHFDRETDLSNNDQYPIDYFTLRYWADPYGQITTFSYEQIPGKFDPHDIRINRVTDASGRFLAYSYDITSGVYPSQITASNGQWVRYTWAPFNSSIGRQLIQVDYSDGTFATYTYDRVPIITSDGSPGTLPMLITAQDTRAEGPMRAIQYEYTASPQKDFPGEIKAERHFGDGSLVSVFTHNSGRTTSTDTRGDGPSRTFNLQKVNGIPLVMSKSDFYGRLEYYYYDTNNYLRQVTDRRGYSTTYTNEPILGRPKVVTHPAPENSTIQYDYSDSSNPYYVRSRTDENLKTTIYTRNSITHQVERVDYPDGAWEEFIYNSFGQVQTHRRTNGVYDAYDHFAYDTTGRLIKRWNPTPSGAYPPPDTLPHYTYTYFSKNDVWEWEDRISSVTDPLGRVVTYEYDRGPDGVQRAGRGLVTRIQYWSDTHDGAFPTGTSLSFGYDIYGNRTSVTDELGHATRYEYDDYNRVVKVTNPMTQSTITNYALDWSNPYVHTSSSIKYILSPMNKNIVFDYDSNLRKITQTVAAETSDVASTWFGYDYEGNLTTTTDPRGKVTTYGYDNRNRQTSIKNEELNETTVIGYDPVGNKIKETRPDAITFRTWDYDAMNRLWHAYDWRTADPPAADQTTTYDRDHAGNIRTITDTKGATYLYDYDLKNLKISETYPPDATNVGRRTYTYHYDDVGNLDFLKNPGNQYKHITFDARNRARHTWWDDGVGPDVATHYDAAGRMTDITTNGGETIVAFGYDDANRKTGEDQTVTGSPTRHVQTDPDADGNRSFLGVTGWYGVRYDYTGRNQLSHIYDANGVPWFDYTYDSAGNMTRREDVYGGVTVATNAQYDALNRPSMWEQKGPGDAFLARSWQQYDKANRLTATWRDEQASKGERFGYNPRSQLTSVSYNADQVWTETPLNSQRDVIYNVDSLNRQSMTDSLEGVTNYAPNALNQYESIDGASNSYDGNFNFAGTGGFWANYDAENHLFWAYNGEDYAQFVYDGLGRCLKRTINWETTLIAYDDWKPIVEWDVWDGQSYVKAWNIYGTGPDEILWRYSDRYGHLRYHLDREGNVAFILDLNGAMREKYTYDAFGRPVVSDADGGNARSWSWYGNRFMFTGREWIPELGLYDYRNRFYHPLLGRFLQADSKGFDAGDMNLFRYCGDDPEDRTDPMGLASVPSQRAYDQPLFPPEQIAEWSRLKNIGMTAGIIIPAPDIAKEWKQTKPELMKDPVMAKIINRLERPDVIVHLYRTNDPASVATFDHGNRIFWNPYTAIKSKADGTWRASPAVALGHELDHTYLKITNPIEYFNNSHTSDSQYRRAEERRVITKGAEASMMKTFYNQKPRTDYDFYHYPVASPLDR